MNSKRIATLAAGLLAMAALALPSPATAQRSGVEIWGAVCGSCHLTPPPNRYTAKDWESIGTHMMVTARLTSAQGEAVIAFLKQGALRVSTGQEEEQDAAAALAATRVVFSPMQVSSVSTPAETFKKQCSACHGAEGKGDGPAAVAFNPRPADLTNPETLAQLSDEAIAKVLAEGKGSMPPFAAQLSAEEITAMVRYVRSLSTPKRARADGSDR